MRTTARVAILVATAFVLSACSAQATTGQLPGPVPEGVAFVEPDADTPPAPEFELELTDGSTLDIVEQWSERPVVLVFFETWCTVCIDQQDGINEVVEEYRDSVLFVGVAGLSSADEVETYVSDNEIAYPVGIDATSDIWLSYAVAEAPLVALISKDGRLLRGWPQGVTGDDLRDQIAQLALR